MASYSFINLPEVFSTSSDQTGLVEAGLRTGKIRRLRRGLYTTNLTDFPEVVVKRNLWKVVSILCPKAVVSHRTALEGRPSPGGLVVVTGAYDRKIDLHGLRIRQLKGPGPLEGDAAFIEGLTMSSRPRYLLECSSGKVYGRESPYLSADAIEEQLEKLFLLGEVTLHQIRDHARRIAVQLDMNQEWERLDSVIGTLLGTRQSKLTSKTAAARAAGRPYDAKRVELFQSLYEELSAWATVSRPDKQNSGTSFANLGFFDAYFSNFIEGTEFAVDEAKEIVFENKIPASRPEDAHDVLGTFRIVGNASAMSTQICNLKTDEFLDLLKGWHFTIMEGRPDKRPGEFKEVANQAGRTLFVDPTLVDGTLRHGFEMARAVRTPFGRSVFLLFLISEVHPFDDGNGRLTRAIANAELVSHSEKRILIPTVFRVEYIDSLRLLSRESQARTLLRMADQAQEFTADVDFSDFDLAEARLSAWNAFDDDSDSRLRRPATR